MPGIIVTGPPRSGTSATARLLGLSGLHSAVSDDLVGGGPNNPTGHWESKTVLAINNQLLEAAECRWWCPPPPGGLVGAPDLAATAQSAFDCVHPASPWVCKDPRFASTLSFWRPLLGDGVACLILARRPDEVVQSLRRTWPISVDHAAALWARALHGSLAVSAGMPAGFVRFPEILANPRLLVAQLAHDLAATDVPVTLAGPSVDEVAQFVRPPQGATDVGDELPSYAWDLWDHICAAVGISVEFLPALVEDESVERTLSPLREALRAGHPLDMRPTFARSTSPAG